MALKGDLSNFSFLQLLNLVHLAHKTGGLMINRANDTARLIFQEGKLTYAQMDHEDNSLARILFEAKKLTLSQYRTIIEHTNHMNDKGLGLLLVNANYLSRDEILRCVLAHYLKVIEQLFTWNQGQFCFDYGLKIPHGRIGVQIDLKNIILEGARQLQELDQLLEEIPSLDMSLQFIEHPNSNVKNIRLTPLEWQVISYVHPQNTLRKIAGAVHLNEWEIRRVVYGLLQAGLVQICRPSNEVHTADIQRKTVAKPSTITSKAEKISLIQRLIQRIRSIPT